MKIRDPEYIIQAINLKRKKREGKENTQKEDNQDISENTNMQEDVSVIGEDFVSSPTTNQSPIMVQQQSEEKRNEDANEQFRMQQLQPGRGRKKWRGRGRGRGRRHGAADNSEEPASSATGELVCADSDALAQSGSSEPAGGAAAPSGSHAASANQQTISYSGAACKETVDSIIHIKNLK
ncbi:Uncharacterized protein OBRU01_22708, partial [Operophtera brumata]